MCGFPQPDRAVKTRHIRTLPRVEEGWSARGLLSLALLFAYLLARRWNLYESLGKGPGGLDRRLLRRNPATGRFFDGSFFSGGARPTSLAEYARGRAASN
jgi:hypothetical protein